VRRLTNAEYAGSVFALLGFDAEAAVAGFPRDATQKLGFTVNDTQIVSSVLASQLDSTAQAMVAAARQSGQFDFIAPCSDPVDDGETCARSFIQSFAAKAYRRPLTAEDVDFTPEDQAEVSVRVPSMHHIFAGVLVSAPCDRAHQRQPGPRGSRQRMPAEFANEGAGGRCPSALRRDETKTSRMVGAAAERDYYGC